MLHIADNNGDGKVAAEVHDDLTPPLELCIRTKWVH